MIFYQVEQRDSQYSGVTILFGVGGYGSHGYEGREAIEEEWYQ